MIWSYLFLNSKKKIDTSSVILLMKLEHMPKGITQNKYQTTMKCSEK